MPLTIEEITEREEALRQEIAEREHLLAAYQLIRADRSKPAEPAATPALPPTTAIHCLEDRPEPATPPIFAAPKTNPELAAIGHRHGSTGAIVAWAIARMTEDYTLTEIAALLRREGYALPPSKISVVLTRLKGRGEIEEVERGSGRRGTIFRKPGHPLAPAAGEADQISETEPATTVAG